MCWYFFFFSSRRRHTRCSRDWSSDVCSSDLDFARVRELGDSLLRVAPMPTAGIAGVAVLLGRPTLAHRLLATEDTAWLSGSADNQPVASPASAEIGRAHV